MTSTLQLQACTVASRLTGCLAQTSGMRLKSSITSGYRRDVDSGTVGRSELLEHCSEMHDAELALAFSGCTIDVWAEEVTPSHLPTLLDAVKVRIHLRKLACC